MLIILVIAISSVSILIVGLQHQAYSTHGCTNYTETGAGNICQDVNPYDLGLNLTYPQGWSIHAGYYTTSTPEYTTLTPETGKAFLFIDEHPFPDLYNDMSALVDHDIGDYQRNGTISAIQRTSSTISGNPAITIHFNFKYSVEDNFSEYQTTYINYGGEEKRFYKFEYYAVDNETFLKYLNDVNNIITSAYRS